MTSSESIFDYPTAEWLKVENTVFMVIRQDQTEDFSSKQKWYNTIINRKQFGFFDNKEISFIACYDVIKKLGECSELSRDYITDMQTKLGLV